MAAINFPQNFLSNFSKKKEEPAQDIESSESKHCGQGQSNSKRWGYDEELDIEALLSRPKPDRRKGNTKKKPRAPEFLKRLDAFIEVDFGEDVVFDCKVVSISKMKISWYHDEQEITDNPRYRATEHGDGVYSLLIPHATKFDEGPYKVRATNFEGSSASTGYLEVSGDFSETPLSRQHRRNSEHAISQPPHFPGIIEQPSIEDLEAHDYDRETPVWMRKSYRNRYRDSWTEDDEDDAGSDTSVESQSGEPSSINGNSTIYSKEECLKDRKWFNSPISNISENCNNDSNIDDSLLCSAARMKVNPMKTYTSCEFENVQNILHEAIANISEQEASIEKDKQFEKKCDIGHIPDLLDGINENEKLLIAKNNFSTVTQHPSEEVQEELENGNSNSTKYETIQRSVNSDKVICKENKLITKDNSLKTFIQDISRILLIFDNVSFPLLYYIFFIIISSFIGTWKEISPPIFTLIISVFSIFSFMYTSIYTNYNNGNKKKKKTKLF